MPIASDQKRGVIKNSKVRKDRKKQKEAIVVAPPTEADPFCFKNYLGKYECKLCGTRHVDQQSYAEHKNGKRHQHFLSKKINKQQGADLNGKTDTISGKPNAQVSISTNKLLMRKREVPKWHIDEVVHPETDKRGYCISLWCPKMKTGTPKYRIVSTYEQCIEPVSSSNQYVVISCYPYRSVGICIANQPINVDTIYEEFDNLAETYVLQFFYA